MANRATTGTIPGYTLGTADVSPSPLDLSDLDKLRKSVTLDRDDERNLQKAGDVLEDQIDAILDLWYGFISSQPHLVATFTSPKGAPHPEYLKKTRERFGQWILDTCRRPYDQTWLDYQHEIGLRHTSAKKNQVDGIESSADHVPLRYVIALIFPIVTTIRDFLRKKGHSEEEVDAMHRAWFKAVVLSVALWTEPYVQNGEY